MKIGDNSPIGQILYLDDVMALTLKQGEKDSSPVSADSPFSVIIKGAVTPTNYKVEVSNCNPKIKTTGVMEDNPDFDESFATLGSADAQGIFHTEGNFRFFRIHNEGGFDADATAYVYVSKLSPIIQ